ncbi:uridine kinase [Spirochaetia bacterium]|nr:uridine kinase [Spirochaetia bacterium]
MNSIHISFPDNHSGECILGTRAETFKDHLGDSGRILVAVKINNEILPLSTRLEVNSHLEPVFLDSAEGLMMYRRSLAFLLAIAVRDIAPDRRLYIGHSLGNSYYYTFADKRVSTQEDRKALLDHLKEKMQKLVKNDLAIRYYLMAYSEALELFEKNRQIDTRMLLDERSESNVPVNECDGFFDLYIEPLVPRTGLLTSFDLMLYQNGFLLRFPGFGKGMQLDPFEDSPVIFSVYDEYKEWGQRIGIHAVGHLNRLVSTRTIKDYISIAEAFQAKKLFEIADKIYEKRDSVKMVLIAGPSSSGKTTTAKKLSINLKVVGFDPVAISLDDYYRGGDKTPLNEKGEPDYECLEALDIPYLNEQLLALMAGNEVTLPVYDFKTGCRRAAGGQNIHMNNRSILIIEGIHGLNDALTPDIDRNMKFKLYVSALTQLNLDDHNRIPTSDNRMLRRMVRDYQFRGSSAARTIKMWPDVQSGEWKYIFPFQNTADAAFNSALTYELAVLKFYAEPLLRSVKPSMPEYAEAVRLLSFLENFAPIPPQYVPSQSIIREFIGESDFKY